MMAPDVARVAAQAIVDEQRARAVALLKAHGIGVPENAALGVEAAQDIGALADATTTDVVALVRSVKGDDQVLPSITRQAQVIYQAVAAAYVMGRKTGAAGGTIPTQ